MRSQGQAALLPPPIRQLCQMEGGKEKSFAGEEITARMKPTTDDADLPPRLWLLAELQPTAPNRYDCCARAFGPVTSLAGLP